MFNKPRRGVNAKWWVTSDNGWLDIWGETQKLNGRGERGPFFYGVGDGTLKWVLEYSSGK